MNITIRLFKTLVRLLLWAIMAVLMSTIISLGFFGFTGIIFVAVDAVGFVGYVLGLLYLSLLPPVLWICITFLFALDPLLDG